MSINYNFQEFTEKDMFEVRLKRTLPDFGYMPCTKRSKFFSFCVAIGFMKFEGTASQKKWHGYRVLVPFIYSTMGNYRPCDVTCNTGEIIIVDKVFRPKEKLNGIFGSHIDGIRPPILPDEYDNA